MVWNKRGNTGGGASSGSGGTKRGGSGRTPLNDGERSTTLTCPRCQGEGQIGNPAAEKDEGGTFTGRDLIKCPRCGGSGTVKSK